MARLTSPTGVTVNVSDEKAEQLASVGYKAEGAKAPAKKAASSKAASSKSEK